MDDESSHRGPHSNQSAVDRSRRRAALEGARVLILNGSFKGKEGVCLGHASADDLWAVSPDGSAEILSLTFEKDFGLLIDLSSDPTRN
jgi:hypothetical protein